MDELKIATEINGVKPDNLLDRMEKIACDSITVTNTKGRERKGKVVFYVAGVLIVGIVGLLCAFVNPWLSAGAVAVCCGAFVLIKEKMYPSVAETAEVTVNQAKMREDIQGILVQLKNTISAENKQVTGDKDSLIKELELTIREKKQMISSLEKVNEDNRKLIEDNCAKLAECERTIEELAQRLRECDAAEQKKSEEDNWLNISDKAVASDIDLSSADSFAQWLQFFATFALNSGNSDVAGIYGKLKSELKLQGIFVYDKLEYDGFGQVQVPDAAYFEDWRSSSEWTSVMKPIVYTKDKVLATGMIK